MRGLPLLLACLTLATATATEPFLKPNDVIAFVGGEDMVVAAEHGYLELLLSKALPTANLRFRSLAKEGDTVFEQQRDLNYPTLEQQLDQIGATVVIAQFGQSESLAGEEKLPEFIAAYEKLLQRLSGPTKRRLLVLKPNPFTPSELSSPVEKERLALLQETLAKYSNGIDALAARPDTVILFKHPREKPAEQEDPPIKSRVSDAKLPPTRDGMHLSPAGAMVSAANIRGALVAHERVESLPKDESNLLPAPLLPGPPLRANKQPKVEKDNLHSLIIEKNRLWYHYYRPQNWAFLAGDRTNQPSSRDHLDPTKRWFPTELEQFLPLIEAREREIAAALAKP